jgi:hypothetical protein
VITYEDIGEILGKSNSSGLSIEQEVEDLGVSLEAALAFAHRSHESIPVLALAGASPEQIISTISLAGLHAVLLIADEIRQRQHVAGDLG